MKLVTDVEFNDLLARADASPRRRSNSNLHEVPEDPIQRLFVAAKRDSYFRAHRHPNKWEFSLIVRGEFDVFTFDENGVVTQRVRTGPNVAVKAFELPPNVFHTWVPRSDDGIFFEVKAGPYDPKAAAEFARWAPEEGDPAAATFVERLLTLQVGACVR
ncbi:MAG TPA: WbuC family cupin fold metalloprotein [Spongiibacteraceae bacterium]|nr:WbuC family cupin fold metalloprotein [Spongiibacteraceae bacterium]